MRRTPYDKQAVITDIAEKKLSPSEIADKYGISIGNVYTIKAASIRAGLINSRGYKSIHQRVKDEKAVFTPAIRERIKNMRDKDLTTTEIHAALAKEIPGVKREDIEKVMARGADIYAENVPSTHPQGGDKPVHNSRRNGGISRR